ncbi:MAG: RNA polymerase sigma factor [Pseudomonadales bacterium]
MNTGMAGSQTSDDDLVDQLRRGDAAAYRRAVTTYTPAMIATARSFCDPSVAEDVVQETWVVVIDAIAGFEGRSSLKTWLCTITANRARDRLRRRKREVQIDVDGPLEPELLSRFDGSGRWALEPRGWDLDQSDPVQELELAALQECLRKHLQLLPENHRAVLIMREQQQMSAEAVCNIVGLSETNMRVMLHRARQRMFAMIERFKETGQC